MNKTIKWTLPFKLALAFAAFCSFGLLLFAQYVAKMDDSPNNRTTLSRIFKSSSGNVTHFFQKENPMQNDNRTGALPLPAIDKTSHRETRLAMFALG